MKLKILIISDYFGKNVPGGAHKSLRIIVDGLLRHKILSIKILAREVEKTKKKNLTILPLNSIISLIQNKAKKIIRPFGADYFLYTLQIFKEIIKFKPNIIITQRDVAFPTILCAKIKKIPVIHIIRDTINLCPKHIDIIKYGKSCLGLKSKKVCYNCIDHWRLLRVLMGDKPKGWENSINSAIYNIFYRFRYYLIRFNLKLINQATINVFASPLLKDILLQNVNSEKIKIINITPIEKKNTEILDFEIYNNELSSQIEAIRNPLLFITPKFKGYQKGENFVIELAKRLPQSFKIFIVGKKLNLEKKNNKILNLDQISLNLLNFIYKKAKITLVPSFQTETFGRVIIESFINKTPVISSPNCGANYFFKEKKYLKIVPIKFNLWVKEIKNVIENYPTIEDEDVNKIYQQFSVNKSQNDFINLILNLIRKKN